MDLVTVSMTAQIEHRLRCAQAEESWRQIASAGRGIGPIGRLRALLARAGELRPERTAVPSAGMAGREPRRHRQRSVA